MTIPEFSDQFDLLFNNITSNQAPGLSEFEKSVFLTKAEKEITKNYFSSTSKGNTLGQGFDDSAKRQADFSVLMKTGTCTQVETTTTTKNVYICVSSGVTKLADSTTLSIVDSEGEPHSLLNSTPYNVTINGVTGKAQIEDPAGTVFFIEGYPFNAAGTLQHLTVTQEGYPMEQIDDRSIIYSYPTDVFVVVNETIRLTDSSKLQVIPLRYDEYTRLMSKPYKRPLKNQAWRLINNGVITSGASTKYVEIILHNGENVPTGGYKVRYVRVPKPIILTDLSGDGLTIDGQSAASTECELDPILHEDVLQRAVELAKIAWTASGQDNAQLELTAGTRSE